MSKPVTIEKIDQSLLHGARPGGEAEPGARACSADGVRPAARCGWRPTSSRTSSTAWLLLGMKDELLESKAIWTCASCQTCVSRCPMEVDTPALIDKLREMARDAPGRTWRRVRIFNETMLGSMQAVRASLRVRADGDLQDAHARLLQRPGEVPDDAAQGQDEALPAVAPAAARRLPRYSTSVRQARRAK